MQRRAYIFIGEVPFIDEMKNINYGDSIIG